MRAVAIHLIGLVAHSAIPGTGSARDGFERFPVVCRKQTESCPLFAKPDSVDGQGRSEGLASKQHAAAIQADIAAHEVGHAGNQQAMLMG